MCVLFHCDVPFSAGGGAAAGGAGGAATAAPSQGTWTLEYA